jgi:hypothetical protein
MPTIYRSTEVGAPPMDGGAGSLVNVLDACLVHGYGALATGVLTSDNTANVSNGDTVTIGSITYTFRSAAPSVVNEVLISGTADASLLNLINTINLTGTAGTTYISAQTAHTEVYAQVAVAAHAVTVFAKRPGTLGNALVTTETAATLSWGGGTLTGGSVSKAALGWTKDYAAPARAIYRPPAGTRCFLEVIDNTPDVTNGAVNARVLGWESVTSLGTGIAESTGGGRFGTPSNPQWQKSATTTCGPNNFRTWMLIGDDRTFYLWIFTGSGAAGYYTYGFGDIRSLVAGDAAKGFIIGQGGFFSGIGTTSYNNEFGGYLNQTNTGHYLQRNWSGVISNVNFGKILYLSPVYVNEATSGSIPYTNRGLLRGLYQPLHPVANWNDGDTFQGSGDLAGKTFLIVKFVVTASAGGTGAYAVETTAWAT